MATVASLRAGMAVTVLGALAASSSSMAAETDLETRVFEPERQQLRTERRQLRKSRRCIVFQCLGPIRDCQANEECAAWMDCLESCGDDTMLCPTVCGAFYQAPEVNAFTRCALDHGCIEIDFSALPACGMPEVPLQPVGDIDGFWWVSAIRGHEYVLYDDCQRFVFTQQDSTRIDVQNSTQVSHQGETRMVENIGHYTRMQDGTLELAYDNWVGYLEQYNPVFVSEQAMVMHVCSRDSSAQEHDYGALVLTREPLSDLGEPDATGLAEAVERTYGVSLSEFRQIGTSGCPNGPSAAQERAEDDHLPDQR